MRWTWVAAAVALAFVAGWLLRGCADESASWSNRESRPDAAPPAAAVATTTPVHPSQPRARTLAKESGDGRAAPPRAQDDPPARKSPSDTGASPAPGGDDKDFRKVTGIVVDSLTGEPVADVRILLGPEGGGWHGSGTEKDGTFEVDLEPDWHAAQDRLVLRAGRDGYRVARVPVTTPKVRVELEKLRVPLRPGRIVGIARGADGKPMNGRICVCIRDDIDLHSPGIWTIADANGRFVLEGIEPGHWTAELSESTAKVDLTVPEGGETPIELRAEFDGAPTGIFAPGDLTQSSFDTQYKRLSDVVETALARTADKNAPFDDPVVRDAMWHRQQLEYQWQRVAPGRDVVVSAQADGASVRLERAQGACYEWRASVADGKATFPSIPYGKWRAVLVRPGEADVAADVDLKSGDGAFEVAVSPAK